MEIQFGRIIILFKVVSRTPFIYILHIAYIIHIKALTRNSTVNRPKKRERKRRRRKSQTIFCFLSTWFSSFFSVSFFLLQSSFIKFGWCIILKVIRPREREREEEAKTILNRFSFHWICLVIYNVGYISNI